MNEPNSIPCICQLVLDQAGTICHIDWEFRMSFRLNTDGEAKV